LFDQFIRQAIPSQAMPPTGQPPAPLSPDVTLPMVQPQAQLHPHVQQGQPQQGKDWQQYTIFIEQSKTDPFRCGHSITIYASGTSTCPVKALQLLYMLKQSPNIKAMHHLQRWQILSIIPPATHTYNTSSSPEQII